MRGESERIVWIHFTKSSDFSCFCRVLAFGGNNRKSTESNQIEIWDQEEEKWNEAPYSMKTDRYDFGYLAVPESVICA